MKLEQFGVFVTKHRQKAETKVAEVRGGERGESELPKYQEVRSTAAGEGAEDEA